MTKKWGNGFFLASVRIYCTCNLKMHQINQEMKFKLRTIECRAAILRKIQVIQLHFCWNDACLDSALRLYIIVIIIMELAWYILYRMYKYSNANYITPWLLLLCIHAELKWLWHMFRNEYRECTEYLLSNTRNERAEQKKEL